MLLVLNTSTVWSLLYNNTCLPRHVTVQAHRTLCRLTTRRAGRAGIRTSPPPRPRRRRFCFLRVAAAGTVDRGSVERDAKNRTARPKCVIGLTHRTSLLAGGPGRGRRRFSSLARTAVTESHLPHARTAEPEATPGVHGIVRPRL